MKFPRHNLYVFLEILGLCLVLISGCVLGWAMFGEKNYVLIGISGLVFTIFLLITLTLMLDPDKIRAIGARSCFEPARRDAGRLQLHQRTTCLRDIASLLFSFGRGDHGYREYPWLLRDGGG